MLLRSSTEEQRLETISRQCQLGSRRLLQSPRDRLRLVLRALISRIELSLERVKIVLRCNETERYLAWDGVGLFKGQLDNLKRAKTHLLDIPADSIRTSRCLALPIEPRSSVPHAHPARSLKQLIRDARTCQAMVDNERDKSLKELADQLGYSRNRFARVLRLNYLAPDIILSIIDGTHPPGLTRTKLVEASLPMDWSLQRKLLGFPERPQPEGGE